MPVLPASAGCEPVGCADGHPRGQRAVDVRAGRDVVVEHRLRAARTPELAEDPQGGEAGEPGMGSVPQGTGRTHVGPSSGAGADQDEPLDALGMVQGVRKGDQAAHGMTHHGNRVGDAGNGQGLVGAGVHLLHRQPGRARRSAGPWRVEADHLVPDPHQPLDQRPGAAVAGDLESMRAGHQQDGPTGTLPVDGKAVAHDQGPRSARGHCRIRPGVRVGPVSAAPRAGTPPAPDPRCRSRPARRPTTSCCP